MICERTYPERVSICKGCRGTGRGRDGGECRNCRGSGRLRVRVTSRIEMHPYIPDDNDIDKNR